MAVIIREYIANEIYFITFTILDWKHIFINDEYCALVYKWFDYMREKYGNQIYGYVIMPNHIHSLISITDKSPNVSKLIQNAKRFLAYDIIKLLQNDAAVLCGETAAERSELISFFGENARYQYGAKHKVFEDGFDALVIQTEKFFYEKLNYIHNNPCVEKWNLAENPEDYKYSSAANYILGKGYYQIDSLIY